MKSNCACMNKDEEEEDEEGQEAEQDELIFEVIVRPHIQKPLYPVSEGVSSSIHAACISAPKIRM